MSHVKHLLATDGLNGSLTQPEAVAAELSALVDGEVVGTSIASVSRTVYFLFRGSEGTLLGLLSPAAARAPAEFQGADTACCVGDVDCRLRVCTCDHHNAAALRRHIPFTAPQLIGEGASLGMGDRLGIATPGHIRAARGSGVRVVLAQQSIREMSRTGRTPEQVLDDVTWSVLREGFREGFGADADHLKTTADADACLAAGFTMFTVDPGDHVDDAADFASPDLLAAKFAALPWEALASTPDDCAKLYAGRTVHLADGREERFSSEALHRAAAKYGAAVAHATAVYRHLAGRKGDEPFEFEVSVDETATPTTALEHFYVASELRRLGVAWTSLAPRFVGDFEKGIDFKGDLTAFERSFADHEAIARQLGPYKLSIHSGSDKFSIYPIAAREAGALVHVKTAGTSYVEALRAIATVDPDLFREILAFACVRYETDRATYHVSGELANVPDAAGLPDESLPELLDQPDTRQVLHVTYGSVLNVTADDGSPLFRDRFYRALLANEDVHLSIIERHLRRHVEPLIH